MAVFVRMCEEEEEDARMGRKKDPSTLFCFNLIQAAGSPFCLCQISSGCPSLRGEAEKPPFVMTRKKRTGFFSVYS